MNIFSEDHLVQEADTPLWREAFFGLDFWALMWRLPCLLLTSTRGQGRPVVLVPPFMAGDYWLSVLANFLTLIGYRTYFCGISENSDCPDYSTDLVLQAVRRAYEQTGMKVSLVGHSLGGLLARSVASDHPELIDRVICMGSPIGREIRTHPMIKETAAKIRERGGKHLKPLCFSGHCTCPFAQNTFGQDRLQVPHFSILSRVDGVADPSSCREKDERLNDEVDSTHVGIVFHPGAFSALARRLAS